MSLLLWNPSDSDNRLPRSSHMKQGLATTMGSRRPVVTWVKCVIPGQVERRLKSPSVTNCNLVDLCPEATPPPATPPRQGSVETGTLRVPGGWGGFQFPVLTVTSCDRDKHSVSANESMSGARHKQLFRDNRQQDASTSFLSANTLQLTPVKALSFKTNLKVWNFAFLLQTPPKPSWTPTPLCFPLLPSGYVVLQTPQAFHEMKCLAFFIFHVFSLTLVELDWPITDVLQNRSINQEKTLADELMMKICIHCNSTVCPFRKCTTQTIMMIKQKAIKSYYGHASSTVYADSPPQLVTVKLF
ncbi:hypothetical protein F2P81_010518 [Scophthalmus maximus]|uniref:Uncharacterized protein n=1 Tax=Scophthalmus maximus TaxID=52904 RepID=A0A6A4T343_SCOMX|nr:hypothetical protein F2P81_010518 [Scophthalmus maximus]